MKTVKLGPATRVCDDDNVWHEFGAVCTLSDELADGLIRVGSATEVESGPATKED